MAAAGSEAAAGSWAGGAPLREGGHAESNACCPGVQGAFRTQSCGPWPVESLAGSRVSRALLGFVSPKQGGGAKSPRRPGAQLSRQDLGPESRARAAVPGQGGSPGRGRQGAPKDPPGSALGWREPRPPAREQHPGDDTSTQTGRGRGDAPNAGPPGERPSPLNLETLKPAEGAGCAQRLGGRERVWWRDWRLGLQRPWGQVSWRWEAGRQGGPGTCNPAGEIVPQAFRSGCGVASVF